MKNAYQKFMTLKEKAEQQERLCEQLGKTSHLKERAAIMFEIDSLLSDMIQCKHELQSIKVWDLCMELESKSDEQLKLCKAFSLEKEQRVKDVLGREIDLLLYEQSKIKHQLEMIK